MLEANAVQYFVKVDVFTIVNEKFTKIRKSMYRAQIKFVQKLRQLKVAL